MTLVLGTVSGVCLTASRVCMQHRAMLRLLTILVLLAGFAGPAAADFDGDGLVGFLDLGFYGRGATPGPSGLACAGSPEASSGAQPCVSPDRLDDDDGDLVVNLLDNARCEVGDDPGAAAISVATNLARGRAEIRVTDRGGGIPDETRDRIFEPLYSTRPFGFGLGLPRVAQVAAQHGGSVEVEHTGDDGTTMLLSVRRGD